MKSLSIFTLLSLFWACNCRGQNNEVYSLRHTLAHPLDSAQYIDALNRLALLLYEKNVDSTFLYTAKARQIASRLNYTKGKADALNNLGVVFDIKGNFQLALKYYNEAYSAYIALGDTVNRVQTLMNIGMVYQEMGKDQRAIDHFEHATKLGDQLKNDSIMSLVIYNYILQYPQQFKGGQLATQIGRAKRIAANHQDERALIAINQLIADELISEGKRQEGLALLDSTLQAALNKHLYYVSMDMFLDMGEQLNGTSPSKAADFLQQGLIIASKNGYLFYGKLFYRQLFELYYSRNEHAKANTYARQLLALYDELAQLDNSSSVDYIDYALKEQQLEDLAIQAHYQTILLILGALVILLAACLLFILSRNLRKTKEFNREISEQNAQMRETLVALEQSQAENTRMMKIVAHDLRNPIGAIVSLVHIMLQAPHSQQDHEILKMIGTSGNDSLALVNELLLVNKQGPYSGTKEAVNLRQMLQHCMGLLENKALAKDQHLELNGEVVVIQGNREKLWRVVSNLIANAIKFSPEGAAIEVMLKKQDKQAVICVKDHGIGIPENMGSKIFDIFTDAGRYGTAGEQSFGLGLAISRQIVEEHQGRIWFEPTPGGGTTFFTTLPLQS